MHRSHQDLRPSSYHHMLDAGGDSVDERGSYGALFVDLHHGDVAGPYHSRSRCYKLDDDALHLERTQEPDIDRNPGAMGWASGDDQK